MTPFTRYATEAGSPHECVSMSMYLSEDEPHRVVGESPVVTCIERPCDAPPPATSRRSSSPGLRPAKVGALRRPKPATSAALLNVQAFTNSSDRTRSGARARISPSRSTRRTPPTCQRQRIAGGGSSHRRVLGEPDRSSLLDHLSIHLEGIRHRSGMTAPASAGSTDSEPSRSAASIARPGPAQITTPCSSRPSSRRLVNPRATPAWRHRRGHP
jgi:hypothetical protein